MARGLSNQDQAVAAWMVSLGFEPWVYSGGEITLWKPANDANLPDVTDEQALFFYTICQKAERKARREGYNAGVAAGIPICPTPNQPKEGD